ncbi:MAG: carboxypeptidase-like regulatory domain-containing protein [candidate division KSB1 bacterium]|nr:carboxypeptidase-like regulatory domain-containing protein [candidate division KSB1 bacterium]
MRYPTLIMSLLLTALLPLAATAGKAPQKATLTGKVLNGSRDNQPVAGQEVVLYTLINGKEVNAPRPKTMTDGSGRFVFRNLDIGETLAYYPLTYYGGVEYSGKLVKADSSRSQLESDIILYESTSSDSAITSEMHHVIVEPGNGGVLKVTELYLFSNRGNYTFAGQFPIPNAKEKFVVLQVQVPEEATEVKYGGDLMSCCAVINGNEIIDTMPFKPGRRQIFLSYVLPYSGTSLAFSRPLYHPVKAFDLFFTDPIRLQAFRVQRAGSPEATAVDNRTERVQFNGKDYNHFTVRSLDKGSRFELAFAGLPEAPRDYRWLAPVVLIALIMFVFAARRKCAPGKPNGRRQDLRSAIQKRRELIEEILALDHRYEAGEIEPASYTARREKLMDAVLQVDDYLSSLSSEAKGSTGHETG